MRLHAPTGQGRCRWSDAGKRREVYFGAFGSADANARYARFAAEWAAAGGPPSPGRAADPSVSEVWRRYRTWAKTHFTKGGRTTSEFYLYTSAAAAWTELYGPTPAAEFKPSGLRAVRATWEAAGLSRDTCNRYAAKLVAVLAWAVSYELVPAAVLGPLREVAPLKAGRTDAPDPEPVAAVPWAVVEATLPHLGAGRPAKGRRVGRFHPGRRAVLEAMIRVQHLARMRPGELCAMRPELVDTARAPWRYAVGEANKNLHKGKARVTFFGPKAREVLAPVLAAAEPGELLWRFPAARGGRRTAVTRLEYGRWIARACARAGVEPWTPNQLRHLGATDVYHAYEDMEAVAAALGNTPEVSRAVYVERPGEAVAARVAEATG